MNEIKELFGLIDMMTEDEKQEFYARAAEVIEKMYGEVSQK